jgi:Flp pilus assembly pilin Flp
MILLLKKLWNDDAAASMSEYGLLIALIAVIAAVGIGIFGRVVDSTLFCVAEFRPCP